MEAGFHVGETDPVGRQRNGTIAAMRAEDIGIPLPEAELKLIRETTRGLPSEEISDFGGDTGDFVSSANIIRLATVYNF